MALVFDAVADSDLVLVGDGEGMVYGEVFPDDAVVLVSCLALAGRMGGIPMFEEPHFSDVFKCFAMNVDVLWTR